MRKKSIFLVGAMMLIMGGAVSPGKNVFATSLESGTNISVSSVCTHEKLRYTYAGLTHSVECEYCGVDFEREAHIDKDGDMVCDACNVGISTTAPTNAEGYTSESLTLNESIKISIKADKSSVNGISVSAWYGSETFERLEIAVDESGESYYKGKVYSKKAEYNEETGYYELLVNFADIDGRDGKYYFDALIFGNTGTQRYVRLSSVEYTKNGISSVSTNRSGDGTLEVFVKAVEGGEIYISTNGEVPSDDSEWLEYNEDEVYEIYDEAESIKEIGVYYRTLGASVAALSTPTLLSVEASENPSAMITEWTTKTANTEIKLPIRGSGINVNINWGDGSTEQTTNSFPTHTYSEAGTYEVRITGTCPIFGYYETSSIDESSDYYTYSQYLTAVKQLGELSATRYGFSLCSALATFTGSATENTFDNVTDMSNMFYKCGKLTNIDLTSFDTSNVTNMSQMFLSCYRLQNIDLGSFDTSNVTDMSKMFSACSALASVNVENFNTSKVTNFNNMFGYCGKLKVADVSNFDISNASDMSNMFAFCQSLEKIITTDFKVSGNCNFSRMFVECASLKSLDLSFVDSSKATSINDLIINCSNLEIIVVTEKFIPQDGGLFENTSNLNGIVITSETPTAEQFTKVKASIPNVIFYVPNVSAETAYENEWNYDFDESRIEPILKLKDNTDITIGTYEIYESGDYLVAGIDVINEEIYTALGYKVKHNSKVIESTPGTYEHEYILTRTVDGVEKDIMSVTKNIIVEKVAVKVPGEFTASEQEFDDKIILSWKNNKDPNVKYELSYEDEDGKLAPVSPLAISPYTHDKLANGTTLKYALRAYDDDGYSAYTYTWGSTKPAIISGDTVLDTVPPIISNISYEPLDSYARTGSKLTFSFNVTDENYYTEYYDLSLFKIMVGEESVPEDYLKIEKEKIESGERVRIIVDKMPKINARAVINFVIEENAIKDKALNGNNKVEYSTPIIYVNSNITTDAPTVETEYNSATITCNQTTNVEMDKAIVYYEYRKSGDVDFIRTENNVVDGLTGNTWYEFRTSLKDVTGNEVASEVVKKFILSVTPQLNIRVDTPLPGTYPSGTEIVINAEFTTPIEIIDFPSLVIKFGTGKNISLNGVYDDESYTIKYSYVITDDFGMLTGVSFEGKVKTLDNKTIDYDLVPSFESTPIFARTGAKKTNVSGDIAYYPYVQDAVNSANDDKILETIEQLLDEENDTAIVVAETKNILLNQNGKSIISRSGEYVVILNRGELTIKEDIGTGKILAEGLENATSIINYGTLTLESGYIKTICESDAGSAVAVSNLGKFIMGSNDKIVKDYSPVVDSTEYGVLSSEGATFEFYDGVIMGAKTKSYSGKIITCDGYNIVTEDIEESREKTYLGVDRIPPIIEYEILTPGYRNDFVNVKIKVKDEDTGIHHVTLNNEEIEMEADFTKEVQFDENGEYVVYAEDNVGNSSFKIIEITTIDKEAPNILSITADEELSDDEVKVLVTVRDYLSGLAGIIIKTTNETPSDDDDWITFSKYPTTKQIVPAIINRGETYYCFAKDRAGNIAMYDGEISFEYIDKIAPVIQSAKIIKENGKDYVIGKAVLVDVVATDNIGVTDILITSNLLSDSEAKESEDWKEYTRYNVYKLPVEGDKVYTIYIWVKDAAGNISIYATASVELKALIIGDNPNDYTGTEHTYNKSSLRFRIKDWNYDFSADKALKKEDVLLRITSGDKVIRNVQTGLTLTKIKDYFSNDSVNYKYEGEIFELDMENIPGTGNLSVVILGGAVSDLARNAIDGIAKLTDIFIDNNAPKIKIVDTGTYDENMKQVRNITVVDGENNLIDAIEIYYKGVTKTYTLTNGSLSLGINDGEIIFAYDKAGNTRKHVVGSSIAPILTTAKTESVLVYGGEAEKIKYTYNGDGPIYIESSDTNIANVSIDTNTKEITILPVNAGECEVTLRTLGTINYMEASTKIQVKVNRRPVILGWSDGKLNYDSTEKRVTATVQNVILGDSVLVTEYKNNIRINSGKYTAEAVSVDNENYTVEGGTNITFDWEILKIDRTLTVDTTDISIRMPNTAKINFTYTGEEADEITTSFVGEKLVEPVITEAHGVGEVLLMPITVGHSTTLVLNIPETTNYNSATANINIRVTKLLTVIFDAQGGTPAWHNRTVEYDEPYGELPVSTNEPREFIGWFTEKEGNGTLITAETIVTIKDKHTLYACWNRAPENVKVSVKSKTTNSITLTMSADDKDGDDLTYDVYMNGVYQATTDKVAQGTNVEYTLTGLTKYTYYDFYVVASDGMQSTQSASGRTRTYCPGDGYSCTAEYCDGYTHETVSCTNCGGDGLVTEYCPGGSTGTCGSCGGTGSTSYTCSGGSSSESTCSICNGTGSCPGSPQVVNEYPLSCHDGAKHQDWKCSTCGIEGYSDLCTVMMDNGKWCTNNNSDNHANNCGGCGGTGKTGSSSTCSHGETSSHTATKSCSNCSGSGSVTTTCSHGYTSSHYPEVTCGTCNGNKTVDKATHPCSHSLSHSHYYCGHIIDGSSSTHQYCEHGNVGLHD